MDDAERLPAAPAGFSRRAARRASSATRPRRQLARAGAVALACLPACLTPPALLPGGAVDLTSCVIQSPVGATAVAVASEDRALRGVFVPAGPDAPLVLHLVGSGQSVASLAGSAHFLFERLHGIGFASLALDYGGVGVSTGDPDVRHLRADAVAMWREALRRAGGDPRRIVLRCTSIGGIAAGEILRAGATPGALLWIAPVSPSTAVHRAIARSAGTLPAWLVSWIFEPLSRVDPLEELARASFPVMLVVSDDDSFVDSGYLEELKDLAAARPWLIAQESGAEHEWLAAAALEPGAREALWLIEGAPLPAPEVEPADAGARERLSADPELRVRCGKLARLAPTLAPEELVAAAAIEDLELASFLVWMRGARGTPPVPFAELEARYAELARLGPRERLFLRTFQVVCGKAPPADLDAAARAVRAWDGHAPLLTTWRRGAAEITHTFEVDAAIEGQFDVPAGVAERRLWILAAYARGMGLIVSRRALSGGEVELGFLGDDGAWNALATGAP